MEFTSDGFNPQLRNEHFSNAVYHAVKTLHPRGVMQLSIWRVDGLPLRSWADMQAIKNELLGDEVEAIELFPAQSRVINNAHVYHLWSLPPGQVFKVGWRRFMTDPPNAE